MFRLVQRGRWRPAVPISAAVRLRRRRRLSGRLQRHVRRTNRLLRRLRQNSTRTRRRLVPYHQGHRLPTGTQPHPPADTRYMSAPITNLNVFA